MLVYHYSDNKFNNFDNDKIGTNTAQYSDSAVVFGLWFFAKPNDTLKCKYEYTCEISLTKEDTYIIADVYGYDIGYLYNEINKKVIYVKNDLEFGLNTVCVKHANSVKVLKIKELR